MKNERPTVLGVTLARGGSKRVPKKNIRPLCGRPLLAFTIEQALCSSYLTDYVVSTDSIEIQEIALKLGASAPFLRPKYLSLDSTSSVAALVHAVRLMERRLKTRYDYVVELMATNPFKTAEDIDACIELLIESSADSVIAVHEVGDAHPARVKKVVNGNLRDFCVAEKGESRRQDLVPRAFVRSGAIYALTRREIMVEGRRYGSPLSKPYLLREDQAVNLDTELDWLLAEAIMSRQGSWSR